ncbi:PIP5K1, partial [Symbiodinium microadriaticum]
DQGKISAFPLPKEAAPGDVLRIAFQKDQGWRCVVVRPREARCLRAMVPGDAVPGISEVLVKAPEGMLRMSVPAAADPGDSLVFTKGLASGSSGTYMCQVQRRHGELVAPSAIGPAEDLRRHVELQRALQESSGYWSHKIERATSSMLEVPGVVVTEAVAEGEVLAVCPSAFHLSPGLIRRLDPDLAALAAVVAREAPADNQDIDVFLVAMFLAGLLNRCTRDCAPELDDARGVILHLFAKVLLCETFEHHPYRLAANNPTGFRSSLSPSCEADLIERLSWGVMERYRLIGMEKRPQYSSEEFLRAWLMVITRAFEIGGTRSTLVPGLDSFNHDSSRKCAKVRLDSSGDMRLEATRCIMPGEEVFLEYGELSNPMLYRTYGFTLPAEVPTVQSCLILPNRLQRVLNQHLPSSHTGRLLQLDSNQLLPELRSLLQACASLGSGEPAQFLRELLECHLDCYKNKTVQEDSRCFLDELRAKQSERGCLEKYLEALDNPASSLGSQLSDVLKRGDCSRQDGSGRELWQDGSSFEGLFRQGRRYRGKVLWASGWYEGDFSNNQLHGEGTLKRRDKVYTGSWVRDHMEGHGQEIWPDGRCYCGSYLKDHRHGFGCFRWRDGRQYCGQWVEGRQHGKGRHSTWERAAFTETALQSYSAFAHGEIALSVQHGV